MTALRRTAGSARELFLFALPHGGQLAARRNAWASMSENAARGRARREAEGAMAQALQHAAYGTQAEGLAGVGAAVR